MLLILDALDGNNKLAWSSLEYDYDIGSDFISIYNKFDQIKNIFFNHILSENQMVLMIMNDAEKLVTT